MKKAALMISIFFLLVNTAVFAEQEKTEHKPVLEDFGGYHYAYMQFNGSYSLISEKAGIFMEEFKKQGLKKEGDIMVAYYNSPRVNKKEDLEWAVSYPIAAGAEVKPPLKKAEFKKVLCVTMIHVGSAKTIQASNDKVKDYIDNNGYEMVWPAYEIFCSKPPHVKIIHPVIKK